MQYAIKLTLTDGVYIASCRDLPAFNSVGDTRAEALRESVDALFLALHGYIDENCAPPAPSEKREDEYWLALPPHDMAQLGLHDAK